MSDRYAHILAQIREGTFLLVVNSRDCKWAIYRNTRTPDFHEREKEVVFTGEAFDLPDHLAPLRYERFEHEVWSNRYDYHTSAICLSQIRGIYQTEEEVFNVAAQFRAAEEAYAEAVEPHRARFAVLAKLVAD